jgi:cell division protein ZipA
MDELRWILLAAGVVLIAGVYLWGLRSRRRSAAPEPERVARFEPAAVPRSAAAFQRVDPEFGPAEPDSDESRPVIEVERDEWHVRPGAAARHEPRIEPVEPNRSNEPPAAPIEVAPAATPRQQSREPALEQKVLALRIVSAAAAPFPGRTLREAIESQGLAFGRHRIFHRLHGDGRAVFSLASLKEPGTFDRATMDEASFRGVAMFAVLPGPLDGERAFDELVAAARAIAARLGGLLQDERGVALGVARAGQLREDAAAFGSASPDA